jgi:hypothetical protein
MISGGMMTGLVTFRFHDVVCAHAVMSNRIGLGKRHHRSMKKRHESKQHG